MEIIPSWQRKRSDHQPIVTFAVIADSHMNPQDDSSTSPWEVNRLANARSKAVVDELNAIGPDFVVHLGDMIHPVPAQDSYSSAAARFWNVFGELSMPLHVVPGNHDVGDKPLEWTPAAVVTEDYVELYERNFGPSYYSFSEHDCEFIIINAQLLNTGFAAEQQQRQWLERTLEGSESKRTFLFLHYPPYVHEPGEHGHYDNIDEPGRSWLLELFHRHEVEAVFAGHVHNFFYDHRAGTDFYILPSISFVRSDYSEFARVVPKDPDHGRNDVAKLGYFLVEVYADDHRPIICRTYGREEAIATFEGSSITPVLPFASRERAAPVGIDLRHPWAEVVQIPYTGGVDEFDRKRARNDYPLMALWELGITDLRVPLSDLADPLTGSRARVLGRNGQRFVPFVFGLPSAPERETIRRQRELIDAVEIILPGGFEERLDEIAAVRADLELPIWISKMRGHDDIATQDGRYFHVINHGYLLDEVELLSRALEGSPVAGIDGIVFRIGSDLEPGKALLQISELAKSVGVQAIAHIRFAGEVPAEAVTDEMAATNRTAEVLAMSSAYPEVRTYLDSLIDQDRGYFPRTGLLDRQYNLRLAGKVFRNLRATLSLPAQVAALPGSCEVPGLVLTSSQAVQVLLLPNGSREVTTIALDAELDHWEGASAFVVDLSQGRAFEVLCRNVESAIRLAEPVTVDGPTLLEFPTAPRRDGLPPMQARADPE